MVIYLLLSLRGTKQKWCMDAPLMNLRIIKGEIKEIKGDEIKGDVTIF